MKRVQSLWVQASMVLFDKDSWRWSSFNNGVHPVQFVSTAVEKEHEQRPKI